MPKDNWKLKQLLQDIESTNQSRNSFNLLRLCNEHPRTYGTKGSEARRLVQKKFSLLKRLPITSYVRLLHERQVDPSAVTLRAIQ
jgi:hypothetical protein